MPHGKSRKGIDVASCKIEKAYVEELDRITKILNYPSRSETLRRAIYKFVNSFKKEKQS